MVEQLTFHYSLCFLWVLSLFNKHLKHLSELECLQKLQQKIIEKRRLDCNSELAQLGTQCSTDIEYQ